MIQRKGCHSCLPLPVFPNTTTTLCITISTFKATCCDSHSLRLLDLMQTQIQAPACQPLISSPSLREAPSSCCTHVTRTCCFSSHAVASLCFTVPSEADEHHALFLPILSSQCVNEHRLFLRLTVYHRSRNMTHQRKYLPLLPWRRSPAPQSGLCTNYIHEGMMLSVHRHRAHLVSINAMMSYSFDNRCSTDDPASVLPKRS